MSEPTIPEITSATPGSPAPGLSQMERVLYTFTAPSKTSTDILRSTNWLVPFILIVIVSVAFSYAVQTKIGWAKTYDNMARMNPKAQEKMAEMPPEQQASIRQVSIKGTAISSYAGSIIALIITAIFTLLVWGTINFGFGGTGRFGTIFAVMMYASLISYVAKYLLAIVAIFAGLAPDNFILQNPVGTNLGYFLSDSPPWLMTLGTFIDVLGIWGLIVMVIGCSIVCKVKRGAAAAAVVGWWALFLVIFVGLAAARG